VPDENDHAAAQAVQDEFGLLETMSASSETNIWNHVLKDTGTLGGYANERDVGLKSNLALQDVVRAASMETLLEFRSEVQILGVRPDWMLLYHNGVPVGVVEDKQPAPGL
jgi:hypothetical protein